MKKLLKIPISQKRTRKVWKIRNKLYNAFPVKFRFMELLPLCFGRQNVGVVSETFESLSKILPNYCTKIALNLSLRRDFGRTYLCVRAFTKSQISVWTLKINIFAFVR